MNDVKDFILNFPLYVKKGFFIVVNKIKSSGLNLVLKVKKIELKGKEMQEKGKEMWLKAKNERERDNQK